MMGHCSGPTRTWNRPSRVILERGPSGAAAHGTELLGGFRLVADGRSLARLPTARQQQAIAFLILHARSGPIPRQRVAGSLWPDSTDVQALTNLRRELHHLREGWPNLDALVEAGSRTLAWREGAATIVDLVAFETARGAWTGRRS